MTLPDPLGLAEAFQAGLPFPSVMLEDFLAPEDARALAEAFPADPRGDGRWRAGVHRHSRKWTCADVGVQNAVVRLGLQGRPFCAWLEAVTGISPVFPDPELKGGGLHLSLPGSYLDIHTDFTVHPTLEMRRCLNLLVYLMPEYDPAWGGFLELWEPRMRHCGVNIWPRFNRAVLFATSDRSWHGHPDPMRGPAHAQRRSLALYYYTPWQAGDVRQATTVYRARPWEWPERVRLRLGRIRRAVFA